MQPQDVGEHTKEVYARYGLAMYCAQVLEHGLVNALTILDLIPNRRHLAPTHEHWVLEVDSFERRHFRSTMGRLMSRLREATVVPPDLETMMVKALEDRNWLAHDFFRERALDFMSHGGRERMIHEVDDCRDRLEAADLRLAEIIAPLREAAGVTEEVLDEARQRLLSADPRLG